MGFRSEWHRHHHFAVIYANQMVARGGTKSWIVYYDAHMEVLS